MKKRIYPVFTVIVIMLVCGLTLFAACKSDTGKNPPKATEYEVQTDPNIQNGSVTRSLNKAKEGVVITLNAYPANNYEFDRFEVWKSSDPSVTVPLASANTFVMPAFDVVVSATFIRDDAQEFDVIIDSAIEYGEITFSPAKPRENQQVTLTAAPDFGFKLNNKPVVTGSVSGDDITVNTGSTANTFTFIMPSEDVFVTAVFIDENTPSFAIAIVESAGGSISAERDTAYEGDEITLTVVLEEGFILNSISVDGANGASPAVSGAGLKWTFTMPDEAVTVTASFNDTTVDYAINIGTITNGEVEADPSIAKGGTTVTLTVTPDRGYRFVSVTVTKGSGGTVTLTDIVPSSEFTFVMPYENVTVTAEFIDIPALTFPLVIDNFSGAIGDYTVFTGNQLGGNWQIETTPRTHLYAGVEPNPTTSFGRSGMAVFMTDYNLDPDTCVVLDITVQPAPPYTYTFALTVSGVVYSTTITSVVTTNIQHAIPLSQLKSPANTALSDQSGTLAVQGWSISCAATAGLTYTRVFGISLNSVASRTISKGTVTGPAGNDITLPAFTQVPVGNNVPVNLTISAGNELVGLTYTPAQPGIVEGKPGVTIVYFVMPNANISVGAEFEEMAEPVEWIIENFSDLSGEAGWFGDFCTESYGFWAINMSFQWQSGTQTGPHWLTNGTGNGQTGSDYNTINPANTWIMQIAGNTGLHAGRNLPVALNISGKDTIRILMRRNGTINLEFGLFNGGVASAGYKIPQQTTNGQQVTGGTIDVSKCGTGYWVAITIPNANAWTDVEIPISSFTALGFDASLLTGYAFHVTSTHAPNNWWTNPKFYVDNIVAFTK